MLMMMDTFGNVTQLSHVVIHFDRSNAADYALLSAAEASEPRSFAQRIFLHQSRFLRIPTTIYCLRLNNAAPQIPRRLNSFHLCLRHPPITSRFQR